MTFPTLVGTATWISAAILLDSPEYRAPATHKANMPTGIEPGDLILVFCGKADNGYGDGNDAKWTQLQTSGTTYAINSRVLYAIATGTEDGLSLTTFTLSGGRTGSSQTFVYRGHSGVPICPAYVVANTANPNPPNANGVNGDNVFIAACTTAGIDVTGAPANYTDLAKTFQTGHRVATARRQLSMGNDDPGAFTAGAQAHHAVTVIVPGSAPVAPDRTQALIIS